MKTFAKILLGAWTVFHLPRLLAGGIGGIVRWTLVIGLSRFMYSLDPSFKWATIGAMAGLMGPTVLRWYLLFV
ncbi:hypothetical protein [Pandoraea sp.]|uniref:hypothetical protein n=1 Tax=Pandoraea sp. TaxID=1883445 RepID=UPI00121568FE|nr:hypothetical protein [Pandoraea sp.]TAL56909.1 MAG: hypothetical protein EPN80_01800 [Pandoraea sp.]TAM17703.1 MAG: hypothetical protein EPN65_09800 [Pandoraea sp.]